MKSWSNRFKPRKARIELIPMIDTMVFLLVFFMIASLAMTKQKGIAVALPKADSAPKATWADRALVISAKADGEVYLDKTRIDESEMQSAIAKRLKAKPDLIVVINAAEMLRHRDVVRLMDIARMAGATHLAIATDGKRGDGEPPT
jgi:biopolymer transport protein ExbD